MNDLPDIANRDDVRRNVVHAIHNWPNPRPKRTEMARLLGVNRSTISRWESGKSKSCPTDRNVTIVAGHTGIDAALFYLPHDKYLAGARSQPHMRKDYGGIQQQIALGAIVKWKDRWSECFERHNGSYFVYNRIGRPSAASDVKGQIAVSLLTVDKKTDRGITFELHNIDNRERAATGKVIHYVYKGLLFPIENTLFFCGEEQSGDEPLAMVTTSSQKSPPSLLAGYLAAVGVSLGQRVPAGANVVLAFRSRKRLTLDDAQVQKEVGVFEEDRVVPEIRRSL